LDVGHFVQLCVNGVTLGSLYALIALGFSMIYGILGLLNFAHGDVLMVGAFTGFYVLTAFGGARSPSIPIAVVLPLMFVTAMLACGTLGVIIERFAYRPLRDAPRMAPLISALGVSFFLENVALLIFGAQYRSYDSFNMDGGKLITLGIHWGVLNVSLIRMLVILSAILLMIALTLAVQRTKLGKAMRATAFDREAAAMMGIDIDRVIAVTFFVGSALSGAAGVMFGLLFNNVYHFMGFYAGLKGFTAAVVGGIGSLPGSMAGGLMIGLGEAFAAGYLPQGSTFQDFWVFLLLIVVLLLRPSGVLGRARIKKV
jgi:branched-chain amino acid transport system permease protein